MRTITPTTDLQDEIIANFREAFAELRCLGSERMHRADMSMSHFHLMSMLDRHGSMTMSRIAELLGVSVSNATGLIDRIEERGLVERTRVPHDRRVVHVQLTDAGRQMLHEVELFKEDMIHGILNRLDERQLRRVALAMSDLRAAVVDEPQLGPVRPAPSARPAGTRLARGVVPDRLTGPTSPATRPSERTHSWKPCLPASRAAARRSPRIPPSD